MDIQFELTPQTAQIQGRYRRVSIRAYREDGQHFGAVGILTTDPERGPVVTINKPVSPEGLAKIAEAVLAEARNWPAPRPAPPEPVLEEPDQPDEG